MVNTQHYDQAMSMTLRRCFSRRNLMFVQLSGPSKLPKPILLLPRVALPNKKRSREDKTRRLWKELLYGLMLVHLST